MSRRARIITELQGRNIEIERKMTTITTRYKTQPKHHRRIERKRRIH
jgi:hypothetical protein